VRIVDANVLLYAVNDAAAHHRVARRWLDRALSGEEAVGFTWPVILAFLRLATHPAIFARPLPADRAIDVVRGWLGQPVSTVIEPSQRHIEVLAGLLVEAGTAGNLVMDGHLAAVAIEHGATLVSFDTDFGRFAGLARETPA
jgi:uncharacterized protein